MNLKSAGAVLLVAVAIVLVVGGLIADRLGAHGEVVTTLVLCFAVAGLAFAGLSARTIKPSVFQSAGRALPAASVVSLTTMLALSLAGVRAPQVSVFDLSGLAAVCTGLLLFSSLAAAPLRRIAGQTFADAIDARFGSRLVTALTGVLCLCLLAALALWLGPAATAAISAAAGLTPDAARVAVLVLGTLIIAPGGLAGIAAAALMVSAAIAVSWFAPALPAAFAGMAERALWFSRAQETFHAASAPGPDWLLLALAAGGLFTLMNPTAGTRAPDSPVRASRLAVLAAAAIAFMGVFAHEVTRQRVETIQSAHTQSLPPMVFEDRFRGLVRLCGSVLTTPEEAARICARAGISGQLPGDAIALEASGGRWHAAVLGIPAAAGQAFVLAMPMVLLIGLAFVCHAGAAAFSRDLLRRFVLPPATAGGDLALRRLAGVALLAFALYAPGRLPTPDPRAVEALVFAAASVPLPMLVLARWHRVDWRAALCALAGAAMAGAAVWTGYLEGPPAHLAGAGSALLAGMLAALGFRASTGQDHALAVLRGDAPGPLVLERSA